MTVSSTAIITGAGSGIGRAASIALARLGWRVALVGRAESKLRDVAGEIAAIEPAPEPLVIAADLAHAEAPDTIIDRVEHAWGRLDALVNNAGAGWLSPLPDTTLELLRRTFEVNLYGPAMLIARAWRLFERQETRPDGPSPCIVNISTMGTRDPFPGLSAYAASKAALESYVRSIVNEGGELGLRAFGVAPGSVETPMLRSLFSENVLPRDSTMEPDQIAAVIVDCILGRRQQDNGRVIYVSGKRGRMATAVAE